MQLVKEHIDFKRGLDPREAMGIGDNPKYWWNNLKIGDIFQLTKNIPDLRYNKGLYVRITEVKEIQANGDKDIRRVQSYSLSTLSEMQERLWTWNYDFFKEYFIKIHSVKEHINFTRGHKRHKGRRLCIL